MAQKIELGLKLEGQDAIDFYEYLEHPTYTDAAIKCMKEAIEMTKAQRY